MKIRTSHYMVNSHLSSLKSQISNQNQTEVCQIGLYIFCVGVLYIRMYVKLLATNVLNFFGYKRKRKETKQKEPSRGKRTLILLPTNVSQCFKSYLLSLCPC